MSYLLSSSRPWVRLPSLQATRALQVDVQRKLSSHLSNCRSAGLEFIPLVFETLGGLAEDSISTLRSLGRSIALRTGPQDASTCSKQLFHPACCSRPVAGECRIVVAPPAIPPPLSRRFSVVYISVFFINKKKKKKCKRTLGFSFFWVVFLRVPYFCLLSISEVPYVSEPHSCRKLFIYMYLQ